MQEMAGEHEILDLQQPRHLRFPPRILGAHQSQRRSLQESGMPAAGCKFVYTFQKGGVGCVVW